MKNRNQITEAIKTSRTLEQNILNFIKWENEAKKQGLTFEEQDSAEDKEYEFKYAVVEEISSILGITMKQVRSSKMFDRLAQTAKLMSC